MALSGRALFIITHFYASRALFAIPPSEQSPSGGPVRNFQPASLDKIIPIVRKELMHHGAQPPFIDCIRLARLQASASDSLMLHRRFIVVASSMYTVLETP
jgi:hypothetical protein